MKWYNKTKTKCLDISRISFWEFSESEKCSETTKEFRKGIVGGEFLFSESPSTLLVVVDGCEKVFQGKEAEEIYNILQNQKDVI